MAPPLDSPYSSSEDEVLDAPDDITRSEGSDPLPLTKDLQAPATKGDIKAIMNNISAFFNADLDIIREDMSVVTARVTHKAVQIQIDLLEDTRRCADLKVRGIVETVDDQELPHFLRRLSASIVPQCSAKGIQIDSCFILVKSARASAGVSRDVPVHFLMLRDRMAVQNAVKTKTPYHLKETQLHFLQDLCCSTLTWRRSLQRVMQSLRLLGIAYKWGLQLAGIAYKWGPSHTLIATEDSRKYHISSATDIFAAFLLVQPPLQEKVCDPRMA
ncbi:Hypothetical predicted protein [Pelobates cultripes]|uniref:Uncharacterized protein n=1 Tax=Pelobates cultripes TaxID=61616 RepID=A0AAD1W7N0_PELCU|nr:Hypothetical predicted protein [Pelobates cultripes]